MIRGIQDEDRLSGELVLKREHFNQSLASFSVDTSTGNGILVRWPARFVETSCWKRSAHDSLDEEDAPAKSMAEYIYSG